MSIKEDVLEILGGPGDRSYKLDRIIGLVTDPPAPAKASPPPEPQKKKSKRKIFGESEYEPASEV